MRANYREIPGLIEARLPFEGNSMSAKVLDLPTRSHGQIRSADGFLLWDRADYVVYSYGTIIGWGEGPNLYVRSRKWSVTTSRHQGILRRAGATWYQG